MIFNEYKGGKHMEFMVKGTLQNIEQATRDFYLITLKRIATSLQDLSIPTDPVLGHPLIHATIEDILSQGEQLKQLVETEDIDELVELKIDQMDFLLACISDLSYYGDTFSRYLNEPSFVQSQVTTTSLKEFRDYISAYQKQIVRNKTLHQLKPNDITQLHLLKKILKQEELYCVRSIIPECYQVYQTRKNDNFSLLTPIERAQVLLCSIASQHIPNLENYGIEQTLVEPWQAFTGYLQEQESHYMLSKKETN